LSFSSFLKRGLFSWCIPEATTRVIREETL
jgi:hypothetical protein